MTIQEYFKSMSVLGADKARRIALAEDWQNFILDWLVWIMDDIKDGSFIDNINMRDEQFVREYAKLANVDGKSADRLIEEIGTQNAQIDLDRPQIQKDTDREVIQKAYKSANAIRNTNLSNLFSDKVEPEIQARIMNGLPVAAASIVGLAYLFGKDRATTIAVNEGGWIANHEEHYEKVNGGQRTHTWITAGDEKVRDAHFAVDGQTVPIDEPFIVGGYRLYFPGDISDNPPADLIVNCRCVEM